MLPPVNLSIHRCPSCRLSRSLCVCQVAPKLDLATRIEVIMHMGEWPRGSNTGHLVQLTLANAGIRLQGLQHQPVTGEDLLAAPGSLLALFPGCGAKILTPEFVAGLPKPCTLLVPDGNWGQTKSMMRRLPLLKAAIPVALPGPTLNVNRPRRNIFADRMSTFEAIAQAIGCLESAEAETALLTFFTTFAAQFMKMRGRAAVPLDPEL
ncbi:MAG: DTW domain-containing protein [Proteobacteria bacterium]|nr:DTW domain-containing protein [Pseudomonadota bacterium]